MLVRGRGSGGVRSARSEREAVRFVRGNVGGMMVVVVGMVVRLDSTVLSVEGDAGVSVSAMLSLSTVLGSAILGSSSG